MIRVLIFGLSGSGKTTLAKQLVDRFDEGCLVHINADQVREHYDDWDFSTTGRDRQALRMRHLADGVIRAGKLPIVDFICPTEAHRRIFAPDYSVWMNTTKRSEFADTDRIFDPPSNLYKDYVVEQWFDDTGINLAMAIRRFISLRK